MSQYSRKDCRIWRNCKPGTVQKCIDPVDPENAAKNSSLAKTGFDTVENERYKVFHLLNCASPDLGIRTSHVRVLTHRPQVVTASSFPSTVHVSCCEVQRCKRRTPSLGRSVKNMDIERPPRRLEVEPEIASRGGRGGLPPSHVFLHR